MSRDRKWGGLLEAADLPSTMIVGAHRAIFSGSPGAGYRPPDVMPNPLPRTDLVAGTLERFFLDNAARCAAALRDAGADVVMRERVAEHDEAMWRQEFPLMAAWAFGERPDYDISPRRPGARSVNCRR